MSEYDKLIYREEIPIENRKVCKDALLKRLRKAGIDTDGYINSMEEIVVSNGYPLPGPEGETHWGFIFNKKYTKLYLNYADALAEEILILREHNLI